MSDYYDIKQLTKGPITVILPDRRMKPEYYVNWFSSITTVAGFDGPFPDVDHALNIYSRRCKDLCLNVTLIKIEEDDSVINDVYICNIDVLKARYNVLKGAEE